MTIEKTELQEFIDDFLVRIGNFWPGKRLHWDESPLELLTKLKNELDEADQDRELDELQEVLEPPDQDGCHKIQCAFCNRRHNWSDSHDCFCDDAHVRTIRDSGAEISMLRCACGGIAAVSIHDDDIGGALYVGDRE